MLAQSAMFGRVRSREGSEMIAGLPFLKMNRECSVRFCTRQIMESVAFLLLKTNFYQSDFSRYLKISTNVLQLPGIAQDVSPFRDTPCSPGSAVSESGPACDILRHA